MKARLIVAAWARSVSRLLLKVEQRIRDGEKASMRPPRPFPPVAKGGGDLPVLDDLGAVTDLVKERSDLFLRYSEGPAADACTVSSDYEAGVDLPGLSVTTVAPEPWWPRSVEDWVARRICKYAELGEQGGRFPRLLSGRQVANGPDHEPIVEMDEPIARLSPQTVRQAEQWYRRSFQAGQDSTD